MYIYIYNLCELTEKKYIGGAERERERSEKREYKNFFRCLSNFCSLCQAVYLDARNEQIIFSQM